MEVGTVYKVDIDAEMQQAYLDYAMSVIVARALPDVRDGLKPVHRRILYAMYDMNLRPEAAHKKSARIVGEVLGKYHPHGDEAVYEAMARLAQDFSMRYPLIEGQGNFGSIDGDPPAAMRYTEARLTPLAMWMLADIEKDTVDFVPNFDDSMREPAVLPAALPNLLINGASGIAVGMATNIPPHNLNEIAQAMQFMLEKWEALDEISIEDILRYVQGPDFPGGGVLLLSGESDNLISTYSTGRGRFTLQARAHMEEMERGKSRLIVTELPYTINKASLVERIAELVREGKLEGIADLRDESNRQGIRLVIEFARNADPQNVLAALLRLTPMQIAISVNMLTLVNGEPRLLNLKQALRFYLEHRLEVLRRRSEHDLQKAQQRAHILEGLLVALKNLDEVIAIIRRAPDVETARKRLMKAFRLSEVQAQAILEMPLRRLAALERRKIEQEYKDTLATIKSLQQLLRSPKKMRQAIHDELEQARQTFGDGRRTHIVQLKDGQSAVALLTAAESVPDQSFWVSISRDGKIGRSPEEAPPPQSGRQAPLHIVHAHGRDALYLICEDGSAAVLPVHALPLAALPSEGTPFHKVFALSEGQRIASLLALAIPPVDPRQTLKEVPQYILTITHHGYLKKSVLEELPRASAHSFTLMRLNPKDRLGWAHLTNGENEILLVTAKGMAIRFHEREVRPMGLATSGVMGIKLAPDDEVVGAVLLSPKNPSQSELFLISSHGRAKRLKFDPFPLQGRYGQGVQSWKVAPGERLVAATVGKNSQHIIVHLQRQAAKALRLSEAPLQGRAGRGQEVISLKEGDEVISITPWPEKPRLSRANRG